MKKGKQYLATMLALLLSIVSTPALAMMKLNMTPGVSEISKEVYHLHMVIFLVCCAIGAVVFGVLIFSLINYRHSQGAISAKFHDHMMLEIIWATIPFFILVIMAIPATKVIMAMHDTAKADVTIKITGHQWKWQYEYLNNGVQFFSNLSTPQSQIHNKEKKNKWYLLEVDNELVVPINQKIRFLVTSNDVLHSWWVPAFAIKRDAIPGFIHESWTRIKKPGVYRGQCAELCGVGHAYMPIVVRAVTEEDYKTWTKEQLDKIAKAQAAAAQNWSVEKLMALGKTAYGKYCAACHKLDGTGQPPVFPALKSSSVAVGKPISRHINLVLHGVPGTAMQAFGPQLTDAELAAIITYERNSWGNNTADVVQPSEVTKLRNKN